MLKKLVLVVGMLSVSGCVTNGEDFPSDLEWVNMGATKKEDVRSLLGEPYSVGSSSGRQTWKYGFYRSKLLGKSMAKELKFYWDTDGTVKNFTFESSFPNDKK